MIGWDPPSKEQFPLFCPNCYSEEIMGILMPKPEGLEGLPIEKVEHEGRSFQAVAGFLCFDCNQLSFTDGSSIDAPPQLVAQAEAEKNRKLEAGEIEHAREANSDWDDEQDREDQLSFGPFLNCPDCNEPFELEIEDTYYPEAYPMQWALRCPECGQEAPGHAYLDNNHSPEYQQALDFAASQDNATPKLDYASALSVLPDDTSVWGDLIYNQDLADNILEIAKRRNEIPELIEAYENFREEVLESFQELEEMNWEYLLPHPKYDSEYLDENGDVTDDWYESQSYRSAIEDLERQHPGMQALNKMQALLAPYMETNAPNQRQGAATTKKLVEWKNLVENSLGPDQSRIIAQDEEGWSVRQPQTYADVNRIGFLMNNCWALHGSDEYLSDIYDAHPQRPGTDPMSFKDLDPDLNIEINDSVMALFDPNGIPRLAWNALQGGFQDILGRHNSDPKPEYIARINSLLENTDHLPQTVLAPSSEYTPWSAQDDSMPWQNYVDNRTASWDDLYNDDQKELGFCPDCGELAPILYLDEGIRLVGCLHCKTETNLFSNAQQKLTSDTEEFWVKRYQSQGIPLPENMDDEDPHYYRYANAWDEELSNVKQMSMADDMLVRQMMTIPEYADKINAKIAENQKQMEGLAAAFEIPVDEFRARPGVQALLLGPVEIARGLFPVLFAQNQFPEINDTWAQDRLDEIWQTKTASQNTYYHVAPRDQIRNILTEGLSAHDDGTESIWGLGQWTDNRGNYLFGPLAQWNGVDIPDYVEQMEFRHNKPFEVLEINLTPEQIERLERDPEDQDIWQMFFDDGDTELGFDEWAEEHEKDRWLLRERILPSQISLPSGSIPEEHETDPNWQFVHQGNAWAEEENKNQLPLPNSICPECGAGSWLFRDFSGSTPKKDIKGRALDWSYFDSVCINDHYVGLQSYDFDDSWPISIGQGGTGDIEVSLKYRPSTRPLVTDESRLEYLNEEIKKHLADKGIKTANANWSDDDYDRYEEWFQSRPTGTHDYDPTWSYDVRLDQKDDPRLILAQKTLDDLIAQYGQEYGIEHGWVYPIDLSEHERHIDAVAIFASGTSAEPIILIDLDAHEGYEDQIPVSVAHEFKHALQEAEGSDPDEDDAEEFGRWGKTAAQNIYYHVAPSEARESILEHGIDATKAMYERSTEDSGFYAFKDLEEASWYKNLMDQMEGPNEDNPPMDIWEVTSDGHTEKDWSLYPNQSEEDETTAVWHSDPISPDRIKLVGSKGLTLHSALQPIVPSSQTPPSRARIAHTDEIVKSSSNAPLADFFSFVKSSNDWDDPVRNPSKLKLPICSQCGEETLMDPYAPHVTACLNCGIDFYDGVNLDGRMSDKDLDWWKQNGKSIKTANAWEDEKDNSPRLSPTSLEHADPNWFWVCPECYRGSFDFDWEDESIPNGHYRCNECGHVGKQDGLNTLWDYYKQSNAWEEAPNNNPQLIPNSICPECEEGSFLYSVGYDNGWPAYISACPNNHETYITEFENHDVAIGRPQQVEDALENVDWDELAGARRNEFTNDADRSLLKELEEVIRRMNSKDNRLAHLGGYVKGSRIFRSPYGTSPDRGAGNRIPNRIGGESSSELGVPDGTDYMGLIEPHITKIEELAWQDTPDWDNWCGNACQRVSDYLNEQGIEHAVTSKPVNPSSNHQWGPHTWIEFPDGTLLDPTITQFKGEGHPSFCGPHAPLSTWRTAVFPPGHPQSENYDRTSSPWRENLDQYGNPRSSSIGSHNQPSLDPRIPEDFQIEPNNCTLNADYLASDIGGRYVEGYARDLEENPEWVPHAWVELDEDIIDPTWGIGNFEYKEDPEAWAFRESSIGVPEDSKTGRSSLANLWEENDDVPLPNSQCPECSGPAYEFSLDDYGDHEKVYFCPSCLKQYSSKGYYYDFEDEQQLHEEIEYFLRKHEEAVLKTFGTPAWEPADGTPRQGSKFGTPDLSHFVGVEECTEIAQAIENEFPELRVDAGFYLDQGEWKDHAWNVGPDGTIYDATHGQFDPDVPLYIGPNDGRYKSFRDDWNEIEAQGWDGEKFASWGEENKSQMAIPSATCPECLKPVAYQFLMPWWEYASNEEDPQEFYVTLCPECLLSVSDEGYKFFDTEEEFGKELEKFALDPVAEEQRRFGSVLTGDWQGRVGASRTSALTRTQYLEIAQELDQKLGPDRSIVVYTFPNGWTVRELTTLGDVHREGELMGSCLSSNAGDCHPIWEYAWEGLGQDEDLDFSQYIGEEGPMLSLRDPDNLPHLSWADGSILGKHNSDPKPEYQAMWDEFLNSEEGYSYPFRLISRLGASRSNDEIQQWVDRNPSARRYLYGGCGDFARAVQKSAFDSDGKELRLGRHIVQGEEEDGFTPYDIHHIFAHDDEYAYDVMGRHPLPYQIEGFVDEYDVPDLDYEWPSADEDIEAAYPEALEVWQNRISRLGASRKISVPAPDNWQELVTPRAFNKEQVGQPRYGYHGTSLAKAQRILREGLKPWDSEDVDQVHGNPHEIEFFEPRPGHVYIALDPAIAMNATADRFEGEPAILRIDLSQLDPQKINPDEDGHPQAGEYDSWEQAVEDGQGDWDWENWKTLGQWAEQTGFGDDPNETVEQLNSYSSLAYQGIVPPSAIELMNIADDGTVMFNEDEFGPHLAADIPQGEKVFEIRQPFLMDNEGNMVIGYKGTHHEDLDPDYVQEVFGLSDEAANNINYWQSISPFEGHILWLDDGPHIQWPSAVDASRWSFEEKLLDYAKSVREEGEWINRGAPREANAWDNKPNTNQLQLTICPGCGNSKDIIHLPRSGRTKEEILCPQCDSWWVRGSSWWKAPQGFLRGAISAFDDYRLLENEYQEAIASFRNLRQANAWESVDEEEGNMLPDGIPCNNCGAPTYHMPGLREQDSFFLCPECNHVSHKDDSFSMPKKEIAEDIEEHGWSRFKRNSKVSSIWDREVAIDSKTGR